MTEWEPATDAEVAMRNALRTDDQESYFRILAGVDLLLPVSADALAGLAPLGWGTWSTGGRTHVLAFTSPSALQACLADYTGSARRVAYAELAETWPNLEWWLAVNPGLPIEGYLPAWFVAQLSRGDLRLPTRGPGPAGSSAPNRIQDLHAAATLAATAAAQGYNTSAQSYAAPASGGPIQAGASTASSAVPDESGPAHGSAVPSAAVSAYAGQPSADPRSGEPAAADSRPGPQASAAQAGSAGSVGPGGLPLRTPGAVLPSGLPSRIPGTPAGQDGGIPGGQFNGFGTGPADRSAQRGGSPQEARGLAGASPTRPGSGGDVPAAYRPPTVPSREPASGAPGPAGAGALDAPGSRPAPGTSPERSSPAEPPPPQRPDAPLPTRTPMAQTPPLPAHIPPPADIEDDAAPGGAGAISAKLAARDGAISAKLAGAAGLSQVGGRTGPEQGAQDQSSAPGGLPRRQVTRPEERPASMAAAAPAVTGRTSESPQPSTQEPAQPPPAQPGLRPPVIPGAGGAGRSTTSPMVPAAAVRPTVPPATAAPQAGAPEAQAASAPTPSRPRPEAPSPEPTTTGPAAADPSATDVAGTGAGGPGSTAEDFGEDFIPANEVERDLHHAVEDGSTDSFLSTLLLATVLVPVAPKSRPGSAPGESGFAFRTEEIDGDTFLVVFTSRDRLAEHFAEPTRTVGVRFVDLIRNWPDPAWSFAVNPASPIGARYPGPQVIALASWAVEAGLGGDPLEAPAEQPPRPAEPTAQLTIMQKAVPAEQIDYYLERGYDRVAGFVHRAGEVEHLRVPGELFAALGLLYDGSPYQADAKEAFVLRWPAHRPSLYRIPYGGQSEQALRAMDGWVIERPPFRGNGFAPGEGKDVIAEFKVDSVRLPHGAQLWRMDADGTEQMIAVFDCDAPMWRRVGGQ